jgi:serine phosphatase RsbU (regulator of sigma subunit)
MLSWLSQLVERQSEQRLLNQQTEQAGAVLTVSVAQVRAPLEAIARSAAVTEGDDATFAALAAPLVGPTAAYSGMTLFRTGSAVALAHVGAPLAIEIDDQREREVLQATASQPFAIANILDRGHVLGYAVVDRTPSPRYVVYAERSLRAPGTTRRTDEPFAQLDYAIYLGPTAQPDHLLSTSVASPPIHGLQASVLVPFGDTKLLLVTTPIGHLSGGLPANLWWIVLITGTVITVAVAALIRSIAASRNRATRLATENAELYERERHVALTLQLGLLPRSLTAPPGTELATRYWPAGSADLVGGDFYDVFRIDDHRWGVAIGDVCGKGVEAATTTSLLRHSLRTATRFSSSPSEALLAIRLALDDFDPTTFCTICYIVVEFDGRSGAELTVALGGHPQPLLARRSGLVEALGTPGTVVGLVEPGFTDVTVEVQQGDTLFLYTDGLTDAPGEEGVPIDEVETLLTEHRASDLDTLADLIRTLKRRRRPRGSHDDTAVILLRFSDQTALLHSNGDRKAQQGDAPRPLQRTSRPG